ERGQAGDVSAVQEVRRALAAYPGLMEQICDLGRIAEQAVLDYLAGTNLTLQEAARQFAAGLREELAGEAPSPLEKVLANRVVLSWLWAHAGDLELSGVLKTRPDTHARAQAAAKRVEPAERRLAAAAKSLAVVRKLLPKPRPVSPVELLQADVPEAPTRRRRQPQASAAAATPN